jgi:hypothetical protein
MGRWLLATAPICLALLAELAERAKRSKRFPPSRRGNRRDVFRRSLYQNLAAMHEAMFGIAPRVRDVDETRDGPSAHWVARVIRIAAGRIERCFPPPPGSPNEARQEVEAVLDLDRRSVQTKGRYLEEGWRDWLEAKPQSQNTLH